MHTILVFVILVIAMSVLIRVVDLALVGFNLLPKQVVTKKSGMTETLADNIASALQLAEFSDSGQYDAGASGIEAGTTEVVANVERLAEGFQVVVESAGEFVASALEGLSSQ